MTMGCGHWSTTELPYAAHLHDEMVAEAGR